MQFMFSKPLAMPAGCCGELLKIIKKDRKKDT